MSAALSLCCVGAGLVAEALCLESLPEWIRIPNVINESSAPLPILEHAQRSRATSLVFIILLCDFFALLHWFDATDTLYLESTRQAETLVSYKGTVLAPALDRIIRRGAPSYAHMEITGAMRESRARYNSGAGWAAGNHRSIGSFADKIGNALSKELRTAICMLRCMVLFIPTCLQSPLGIAPKNDGKGGVRQLVDTSFTGAGPAGLLPASLNAASPKEFHTTPIYGGARMHFIWMIYQMRIAHPDCRIFLLLVDSANAFKQVKMHARMLALVCVCVFSYVLFFSAMSFGQTWSPSEYSCVEESVMIIFRTFSMNSITAIPAAIQFAEFFRRPDPPPDPGVSLVSAWSDAFNPGRVVTRDTLFDGDMFVDDGLLAMIEGMDLHLILAAFLWSKLCFFSPIAFPVRPYFINLVKLSEGWFVIGKVLGYIINTNLLTISAPREKLSETRQVMVDWMEGRTKLTAREIESLLGRIRFIAVFLPCGSFLTARLQECLTTILHGFRLGAHGVLIPTSGDPRKSHVRYTLPGLVRPEFLQLLHYLDCGDDCSPFLECSFERLLWRVPQRNCPSDASGWGGGGWCVEERWGWRLEWPIEVRAWFQRERNINVLEMVAIVINYVIMTARSSHSARMVPALFWTDNTSACSWASTARMPVPAAAAVGRILDFWSINSKVHLRAGYVPGPANPTADSLSRAAPEGVTYTRDSSSNHFLFQSPPWSRQVDLMIAIPPLLASALFTAVCSGTSPIPRDLAKMKEELDLIILRSGCERT